MSYHPLSHHLLVALELPDVDDQGRHLVPGSAAGLVYGRQVDPPVAVVLEVGPDVRGYATGDRIVVTPDLGGRLDLGDGLVGQFVATMELDARRGRLVPTDEVAAVLTEAGPRATGRRLVCRPVPAARASELIEGVHVADGCERLDVWSVGIDVHGIEQFDVVLVPVESHRRIEWQDAGETWVSVLASEVVAVVEEAPQAHAERVSS